MPSWRMLPGRALGVAWMLVLSAAGVVAAAYPASAFACPPPQTEQLLCVAFSPIHVPVPISDGTTMAIGILLAFCAVLAMRRRVRPGLRGWIPVIALGLLASALEPFGEAGALPPGPVPLDLVTSPAQLTVVNTTGSANPYFVQVSNPHRLPVTIDAISLTPGTPAPPLVSYVIEPAGTTCVVGMTVPSGGTCTIELVKPTPG